jgi:hypothetical protein
MTEPRKRIGFRTSYDEPEVEPMKQINTAEESEEEQNSTVMLEDYIPGAVYDAQGNIVTYQSFRAKIKKDRAEARNLNWSALARLILYTSLGASILLLSYGTYNKYFKIDKVKQAIVCPQKER